MLQSELYLKFWISERFLSSKVELRRLDCIGSWGARIKYQQIFLKIYMQYKIKGVPKSVQHEKRWVRVLPVSIGLGFLWQKEYHILIYSNGKFQCNHCYVNSTWKWWSEIGRDDIFFNNKATSQANILTRSILELQTKLKIYQSLHLGHSLHMGIKIDPILHVSFFNLTTTF